MLPTQMDRLSAVSFLLLSAVLLSSCQKGGGISPQGKNNVNPSPISKSVGPFQPQCLEDTQHISTSPGIIGGELLKNESQLAQVVGLLLIKWSFVENGKPQQEFSRCTASRLDQNVVITAAHCVSPWRTAFNLDAKGVPKEPIRMTAYFISGAQPFCNLQSEVDFEEALRQMKAQRALEVRVHESFIDYKNRIINSQFDLALLRLEEQFESPKNFETIKLVTSQNLASSDQIFIAGYGLSGVNREAETLQPALRFARTHLATASTLKDMGFDPSRSRSSETDQTISELSLPPEDRSSILLANLAEGRNACSGDSGGPAVVAQGRALLQFGLAVKVENFGVNIDPCLGATHYLNLGKLQPWITLNFDRIKGKSTKQGRDLFVESN